MRSQPLVIPFGGHEPTIAPTAWVAADVTLVGAVTLGDRSSVWFTTVLRADGDRIDIGADSNIQDGCVLHTDPGFPILVGAGVSVGHRAVLHGCTVEDGVLIGMGAIVLNGARVGAGSLVAAGSVVLEGSVVPPRCLVAGVPARVRREVSAAEAERLRANARDYVARAGRYAARS